jgi:diguanylate cyclase
VVGSYNPWLVCLSVLVAVLVSHTALSLSSKVASATRTGRLGWLAGGAFVMGGGIWSMHFIGMLAFTLPIPLSYDVMATARSLVIAIAASAFALYIASGSKLGTTKLTWSALLLGAGISAMHYSGMSAIQITPMITYEPELVVVSVVIAIAASFGALWLFFKLRRGRSRFMRYARIGAALIMGAAISGMHYVGMAASKFAPDSYCTGTGGLNNGWLAVTVALLALTLLSTTSILLMYEAYLEQKTRKHSEMLERANDQLQYAATHDPLTALPNRLLLADRITQAIARCSRHRSQFALMVVDLDRFKSINESFGHVAGDEVLREISRRLQALMRKTDTLARFGGDELVMIVDEIVSQNGAEMVASGVLEQIRRPITVCGVEVQVSASIGVSVCPRDGTSVDELLKHADAAMYHAKKLGRNHAQFFMPTMNENSREKIELEGALRRALVNGEFELHYQPKVDVITGRIEAVEALIRWRHPTLGLISPAKFIPLAEESGLIVPMGEWVLRQACMQARAWQNAGMRPVRIAVNLSAKQFKQKLLFEIVSAALARADLDPSLLELELTESAVMEDAEQSVQILRRLSDHGIRIAVDDFGTGYSSLSYLRRLPLDKLKIDRAFIREIATSRDDAEIVRAIVSLAHSLRLKVIAEGVETEDQLRFLRSLGCDLYQGYLCSPPLTATELETLVREQQQTQAQATVMRLNDTMRNRALRMV